MKTLKAMSCFIFYTLIIMFAVPCFLIKITDPAQAAEKLSTYELTKNETFYWLVAHEANQPELCEKINATSVSTAGFSAPGQQISLDRSDCYYHTAWHNNRPDLCKKIKSISTDFLDGSKFNEQYCLENIGTDYNTNSPMLGEEDFISIFSSLGYSLGDLKARFIPKSYEGYDDYMLYFGAVEGLKNDTPATREMLQKIKAMPSY